MEVDHSLNACVTRAGESHCVYASRRGLFVSADAGSVDAALARGLRAAAAQHGAVSGMAPRLASIHAAGTSVRSGPPSISEPHTRVRSRPPSARRSSVMSAAACERLEIHDRAHAGEHKARTGRFRHRAGPWYVRVGCDAQATRSKRYSTS